MSKWIDNAVSEFNQQSTAAIPDHFKTVDGKVKSKFANGTKEYVDYLCAVGKNFIDKLPKTNSTDACHGFAEVLFFCYYQILSRVDINFLICGICKLNSQTG